MSGFGEGQNFTFVLKLDIITLNRDCLSLEGLVFLSKSELMSCAGAEDRGKGAAGDKPEQHFDAICQRRGGQENAKGAVPNCTSS